MSGWIVLGGLSVLAFAAIVILGKLPRALWQVPASAILLGMTGYALQGRPDLPDAPAVERPAKVETGNELIRIRAEMDRSYRPGKRYLVTSDAFARDGSYALAAGYIQAGLNQYPREADLWAGLGLQLMLASEGRLSPPAKMAFDKARRLDKNQPAPDYFEGLAQLFDGDIDGTLARWKALLATANPNDRWRKRLESQIAGLEALKAQAQKQSEQPAATR